MIFILSFTANIDKGLCALKSAFGLRILSIDHHLVQGWEMAYFKAH